MRKTVVHLVLRMLVAAFLLVPVVYWDGGLVEREATDFVPQYLDQRPLPQKLFDPVRNDLGTYQARELSYLLDLVDAHWLRWLLAHGVILFVPLSAILSTAATVVVFEVGVRRAMPALDGLTATLVLLLYVSNYVFVVTAGMLYRSAKPVLAPVLLATALYLVHVARERSAGPDRRAAILPVLVVFLAGCLMSLLDRQGFFYLGVLCGGLALLQVRRGGYGDLLGATLGALGLMILYNLVLGPVAVRVFNGYWPDFGYQRIPLSQLAIHPEYLAQGTTLLVQATALLVGGFPTWLYLVVGAGLAVAGKLMVPSGCGTVTEVRRRVGPALRRLVSDEKWQLAGLLVGSQVAMWTLMVVRHPPIFEWEDHRLWYYPLPYQALALAGLAWLLEKMAPVGRGRRDSILPLVLVGLIASNVVGWTGHRDVMLGSRWFPAVHRQSSLLKVSLKQGEPHPQLDWPYAPFYTYLRGISVGVPPE